MKRAVISRDALPRIDRTLSEHQKSRRGSIPGLCTNCYPGGHAFEPSRNLGSGWLTRQDNRKP